MAGGQAWPLVGPLSSGEDLRSQCHDRDRNPRGYPYRSRTAPARRPPQNIEKKRQIAGQHWLYASLGKGEAESSNLSGSTRLPNNIKRLRSEPPANDIALEASQGPELGSRAHKSRTVLGDPRPPSQRKPTRGRTVPDPLEAVWEPTLVPILARDPAVQAVTLLRHLQSTDPEGFPDDRVRRMLERRVRDWRALHGPERDVIFRQTPEPGRMTLLHRPSRRASVTHRPAGSARPPAEVFANIASIAAHVRSQWSRRDGKTSRPALRVSSQTRSGIAAWMPYTRPLEPIEIWSGGAHP